MLTIGTGKVPESGPYVVSAPTSDAHIAPFSEHMNVYGLQLLADAGEQKITSEFLCFVAKTNIEMYPKTVPDQLLQKKLLVVTVHKSSLLSQFLTFNHTVIFQENMYIYKATSPVVEDGGEMPDMGENVDGMSSCDTIHEGSEPSGQAMEVDWFNLLNTALVAVIRSRHIPLYVLHRFWNISCTLRRTLHSTIPGLLSGA